MFGVSARGTALLAALASLALPTRALDFGEVEVLSGLGEKLDARIPLRAGPGEWFHVTCLSLAPAAGTAPLPALADGILSVERRSRSANVRVRSAAPVNEPAVTFGITSKCAGAAEGASREFTLLIDPPRVARARPPAARAAVGAPLAPSRARSEVSPIPAIAPAAAPAPRDRPERAAPTSAASTTPAPTSARPRDTAFVLRLTSDPIDVSRSRGFNEKSRAVLRERLRLLDSDDQVAAVLALRDNMQRLEARVAELQLKLAAMPPAMPPRPAAPTAPAPKAEPNLEARQVAAPKIEAPTVPAPSPAMNAPPPPAQAPPAPSPPSTGESFLPGGPWPWLGALGSLALLLAAMAWRRRAKARTSETAQPEAHAATVFPPSLERPGEVEQPIEVALPVRAQPVSGAAAETGPAADPAEALRRRYIEERFPEIANRTIVLDDPGSIVKGARLFYEDGAMPRAVELLRFAIEDRPAEVRPWLALFEIYRLERLAGEYAELAARFRERHEAGDKWEKVRAFGREIDPANPAYQEPPSKSLETIGPRQALRLAQAHADPIAENWLEAPMDFENEVLATELRRSLMARARVDERDLAPNPMPALRSVEMFSVG